MSVYAIKKLRGTGRILAGCGFFTFILLLYVRGQIGLFQLSYQIDERADQLSLKMEAYRRLHFEVEELRAPRRLEKKINDLAMNLTLPKEIQVIKMPAASRRVIAETTLSSQVRDSFQARVSSWVNRWIGVAQAKTDT